METHPEPQVLAARLTQVDVEGAPLLGAGVEVATFHVEITRADRLGPQPVEQRHLGARRDAHCRETGQQVTSLNPSLVKLHLPLAVRNGIATMQL